MKSKCIQCGTNTSIEGELCNACYWKNQATLYKQELLSFAQKLLDDDEVNEENLDYWAEEYLHAYNALANVMEVDDRRRKAERQRDELLEALEWWQLAEEAEEIMYWEGTPLRLCYGAEEEAEATAAYAWKMFEKLAGEAITKAKEDI